MNTPLLDSNSKPSAGEQMSDADLNSGRRRRAGLTIFSLIAAGCAALGAWSLLHGTDLPEGVSPEEYAAAERQFREKYGVAPDRLDVLSLAGELAWREERLETAAACFREIPSDDRKYGPSARLQQAQVLVKLKRADEAERNFREFLALSAKSSATPRAHIVTAYKWLTYLLSVELRFEERKDVLAEMHARGLADVYDSKQLYFPHLLIWHTSSGSRPVAEFLEEDPENPRLRIAMARYLTFEGKLDESRAILEQLRRERPKDPACAAALLECFFEGNDWEQFTAVAGSLPEYTASEPWLLTWMRGEFALHQERWQDAATHFERVLQSDPTNSSCNMGLARAGAELGRDEAHQEALRRSLVLSRIRANLGNTTEHNPEAALELASECDQLGLQDAAETFRRHARRIEQTNHRTNRRAAAHLKDLSQS